MSHFYGALDGDHGQTTRRGTKKSGLSTIAASWKGCITTRVYIDQQGRDCFLVYQDTWFGKGVKQDIVRGIIGEKT